MKYQDLLDTVRDNPSVTGQRRGPLRCGGRAQDAGSLPAVRGSRPAGRAVAGQPRRRRAGAKPTRDPRRRRVGRRGGPAAGHHAGTGPLPGAGSGRGLRHSDPGAVDFLRQRLSSDVLDVLAPAGDSPEVHVVEHAAEPVGVRRRRHRGHLLAHTGHVGSVGPSSVRLGLSGGGPGRAHPPARRRPPRPAGRGAGRPTPARSTASPCGRTGRARRSRGPRGRRRGPTG